MSTCLPLLLTILASPPSGVLETIDARLASGEIDEATRHALRVTAVRDPAALPADLRTALDAAPLLGDRGTRILVEAYQWAAHAGADGEQVLRLLAPPDDLANFIDSDILPIRVSWATAADAALAQSVLEGAENSWTVESDWGFIPPPIEPGLLVPRYRFYVDATGMGGGAYTAPYDYNAGTAWTDCYTYIVVDPENYVEWVPSVVSHEMNHAMQAAMDCDEVVSFWENTATWAMSVVYPYEGWYYATYSMEYFQPFPWRAIDYMDRWNSDAYEYGGALWPIFLVDAYAPSDGPFFMAEVWQAAMQEGGANEPDAYDAIEQVLASRGGPPLDTVVGEFAESRYFVDDKDDGAHMSVASQIGPEGKLMVTATHSATALPIRDAAPPDARRPAPTGSNHILISVPQGTGRDLRLTFDGDDDTRWAVRAVRFGGGPATQTEELAFDGTTWQATHTLPASDHNNLLLVVVNLGLETYDPDDYYWPVSGYTYGLEELIPAPVISAIDPAEVLRDSAGELLTIAGTGFVDGAEFAVAFDDACIVVQSVDVVSDTQVSVTVDVPAECELGVRDVTVTNAGGAQATGPDLLTIVDPPDEERPCGCAISTPARRGGATGAGLLLLLALAVARSRRPVTPR